MIAWLSRGIRAGFGATRPPGSHPDPYQGLGSHPDVVERVWKGLAGGLGFDGRCILYGTPALAHRRAGIVLALSLGTEYALRVPPEALGEADDLGARPVHHYRTSGTVLDLASEFGADWRFGCWSEREIDWVRRMSLAISEAEGL